MFKRGLEMIYRATRHAPPATLLILLMFSTLALAEEPASSLAALDGEPAFIVYDYRYEPGDSGGDPDTGLALCASRCNAMSFDYPNYIMPGGWELLRVATDRELTVPLNNPFIGGNCICTVDEYRVKVNERNRLNKQQ